MLLRSHPSHFRESASQGRLPARPAAPCPGWLARHTITQGCPWRSAHRSSPTEIVTRQMQTQRIQLIVTQKQIEQKQLNRHQLSTVLKKQYFSKMCSYTQHQNNVSFDFLSSEHIVLKHQQSGPSKHALTEPHTSCS